MEKLDTGTETGPGTGASKKKFMEIFKDKHAGGLLGLSLGMVIFLCIGAFVASKRKRAAEGDAKYNFGDFMGASGETHNLGKSILIGLIGGLVFGFIENAGLFFGMDALSDYLPGDNELVRAGFGNTFSDVLGSCLGAFVSVIASDALGVEIDEAPIWSNALGMLAGCLIGIYIPKMVKFGKTKNQKRIGYAGLALFGLALVGITFFAMFKDY